ncbi:MAG: quercetin dioxygenase-like cupin family protein [Gammaproteobacteria bacterium]|jgi:quercetin dioxygenase-like cupin family protein
MTVIRAHDRPTKLASQDNFTGQVWQDPVMVGEAPSRMRATNVSFCPGARTDWHSHPVGQTLYVVSGVGRLQLEGEPVQELRPGDTGIIPPNTRHWHGAAFDRLFTHLAMSEVDDAGGGTEWFEKVSDDDYLKTPAV